MAVKVDGWWIPGDVVEGRHPVLWRRKGLPAIDVALRFTKKRGVALQAGGHLGLWPIELAARFAMVITFEAWEENYKCLRRNVQERGGANIQAAFGALGDVKRVARMQRAKTTGSHYVQTGLKPGACPMVTIDSLNLPELDALFLDVEGYEIRALRGGIGTLARLRPVVLCEENDCGKRYGHAPGDILKLLAPLGYRLAARRKKDIILAC